jgi:hypothetical protein
MAEGMLRLRDDNLLDSGNAVLEDATPKNQDLDIHPVPSDDENGKNKSGIADLMVLTFESLGHSLCIRQNIFAVVIDGDVYFPNARSLGCHSEECECGNLHHIRSEIKSLSEELVLKALSVNEEKITLYEEDNVLPTARVTSQDPEEMPEAPLNGEFGTLDKEDQTGLSQTRVPIKLTMGTDKAPQIQMSGGKGPKFVQVCGKKRRRRKKDVELLKPESHEEKSTEIAEALGKKLESGKAVDTQLGSETYFFRTFFNVFAGNVDLLAFPVLGPTGQGNGPTGQGTTNKDQPPEAPSPGQRPPERLYGLPWDMYRNELCRWGTFAHMPTNAPVFATRLAQAGFVRLEDNTIICFFCGWQHNRWSAWQSSRDIHQRHRPECPMVMGGECGNVPVARPPEDQLQQVFSTWSLSGPIVLAGNGRENGHRAGEGIGAVAAEPRSANIAEPSPSLSTVSAPQSGRQQVVTDSETLPPPPPPPSAVAQGQRSDGIAEGQQGGPPNDGERPLGFTAQLQPPPPPPPPAEANTPRSGQQVVTYQQLGIVTEAPKRPDMAMVNARVGTFREWPHNSSHTPMQLAEAGFYFAGK